MSLLVGAGALLAGAAAYGAWIEPRRFELSRHTIHPARWPAQLDGLTILHVTDLHTHRRGPGERWLAGLTAATPPPDLLLLTGDFAEQAAALPACLGALAGWPARLGRYAVLGNNDTQCHWQRRGVEQALAAAGIELLDDRAVEPAAGFKLAGLRYEAMRFAPRGYRFPIEPAGPADRPRILLAHSPDVLPEAVEAGIELVLCGHTHGGQICLPGGRPLRNNLHRYRPPQFTRGLFQVDETVLVVNRGLGMTRPLMRTFCRPEAIWLTLRAR